MKVLITGGAGYIGSTIASCCVDSGIEPIILDDLSTGLRQYTHGHNFYEGDIADKDVLRKVFLENQDIEFVIHCAAKIVVPESVEKPLDYYLNNVGKTIILLQEMKKYGISKFILSSTASMYKPGSDYMVDENSEVEPLSPYSASKWMLERVIKDYTETGFLNAITLRYFNPIGADPQMRTGLQSPAPTHALGKLIEAYKNNNTFYVTGVNWPTRDGSGLRDYIHVWDLAKAHIEALKRFDSVLKTEGKNYSIINLGTGKGTTVYELVEGFKKATGSNLSIKDAEPRAGDVVGCATRTAKAEQVLQWKAKKTIAQGVKDSLIWSEKLKGIL